jgi:hypothetical protein
MSQEDRIEELEAQAALLTRALGTLIVWMSGSAASPLSRNEWQELLNMLPDTPKKRVR